MNDLLGPLTVVVNDGPVVHLRQRLRVIGPALVADEPLKGRTVLGAPDYVYRVLTLDGLEGTVTARVAGFDRADLIRLSAAEDDVVLESIADVAVLTQGQALSPAEPAKAVRYFANVGTRSITLQPPETPDPLAGPILNTLTLMPGMTVRVVWDHASKGHCCSGGSGGVSFISVTLDGSPVQIDGKRVVLLA